MSQKKAASLTMVDGEDGEKLREEATSESSGTKCTDNRRNAPQAGGKTFGNSWEICSFGCWWAVICCLRSYGSWSLDSTKRFAVGPVNAYSSQKEGCNTKLQVRRLGG